MKCKKINQQVVRRASFFELILCKSKHNDTEELMGGLTLPGRSHGFFHRGMFIRYRPSPHIFNIYALKDRKKELSRHYKKWGQSAMIGSYLGMGMSIEP
jgi:hypothetical protein